MRVLVSLAGLGLVATLGWAGVGLVIVNVSPNEAGGRVLFFAAFYTALLATFGLLAYILSFWLFAAKALRGNLGNSLQHGALWAAVVSVAAVLRMLRELRWTYAALLLGLVVVFQLLLLAKQHPRPQPRPKRVRQS